MAKKIKSALKDTPFFDVVDPKVAKKLKREAKKIAGLEDEQTKEITKQEKESLKRFNLVAFNVFESDKDTIFNELTKPLNAGKLIFSHYSCGMFYYKKL